MNKHWFIFLALSLAVTACGKNDVQGQIIDQTESVETQVVTTQAPTEAPTDVPTETPAAPQLSFDAHTYRDDEAGFAFEHPIGWGIGFQETQSRGDIVQLQDSEGPRLDITVYRWDPKGDLPAYLEVRKAGFESYGTILEERNILIENMQEAVLFLIEGPDGSQSLIFITTLHDRYLQLSGSGDLTLLSEIIQTLRIFEPANTSVEGDPIECFTVTDDSDLWVPCNVIDGIRSRNLVAVQSWMIDPFSIGYWGSEGRSDTPAGITDELGDYGLPQDASMPMTFTADRDAFPPLAGMPPEVIFGPDVDIALIIYSEGWGMDGQGAALLYFTEDENGRFRWYAMVISGAHFDK